MFLFLAMEYIALPDRQDALLSKSTIRPTIFVSGSLGLIQGGKCIQTTPNSTINDDPKQDWCSNIQTSDLNKPWISYSIPGKAFSLTGFSVRNGCCYHHRCCCDPETGRDIDIRCCCDLYSFSLQGSNDNITWKTIHKVEKDKTIYDCQTKTYEFTQTSPYSYIRFHMDEERPGCPKCIQLNQIELYGKLMKSEYPYLTSYDNEEENEESISIIGKVRKI